jgi:hypothetical protein
VQQAFARYAEFQLSDSAKYYMDSVARLAEPDFVPTDEDILRVRAKTTGITEITFQVDDAKFRLVDVGGQRSERKKWMHCFPASDTQLLTSAGFLALDDVLARIAWRRVDGGVVVDDWRGLEVATYDPRTAALVYRRPNAIVVNDADVQTLVEFGSRDISVVTTDGHELYARSTAVDPRLSPSSSFRKVTAGALFDNVANTPRASTAVEFLVAAEGGVGKRDNIAPTALLEAYGRSLPEAARVDEWALAQLDKRGARAVVDGWLAARPRDDRSLFAASEAMRDDLIRLLMHGGYAATFELAYDAGEKRHGWRVSFAERDGVDATLRLTRKQRNNGGDVARKFELRGGRTWCFDMSSAPARNDGFVVARRVRRVTRAEYARAAKALSASSTPVPAPPSEWVTLSASLPTIQGNCFDGVTAILFVVAMSEYDLMLYEDQTVRRMEESMKLFDEMCNSQIFIQTPLVLFLNKSDLFREKIKHVDLSVCFPEYKGGPDFERACAFTKAKFEALNKQPQTKAIYPHVTCATDTENVQFVFNAVKDTLLTAALDDAGL